MVIENPRRYEQPVSIPIESTGMNSCQFGNAVDASWIKGCLFILRFSRGIAIDMRGGSVKKLRSLCIQFHCFKKIDQGEDMDLKTSFEQLAGFL